MKKNDKKDNKNKKITTFEKEDKKVTHVLKRKKI